MGKLKAVRKGLDDLVSGLRDQFSGVDISLSQRDDGIVLNKLVVPESQRGQGIGSSVMGEINRYADDTGQTLALTAAGDFGGSKAGQQRFYKRHGFAPNSGRNKDFVYMENMLRRPQSSMAAAAAVGIGASTQSEDADAGVITKGGKKLIEAFHGSPHKFDKFSMDNIGTGEGAQAYGHGLYFAESEEVARGYRDALTPQNNARIGDNLLTDHYNALTSKLDRIPYDSPEADVVAGKIAFLDDLTDRGIDGARGRVTDPVVAEWVDDFVAPQWSPNGSLYRAHLDVDPDTLLDWDKPLSEQPESVKQWLKSTGYLSNDGTAFRWKGSATGRDVIEIMAATEQARDLGFADDWRKTKEMLEMRGAEPQMASDVLREAGIPGIRYADGMSRGKEGEQTFNYVMFDDKPISIQERGNATPEALAATAMASAAAAFTQRRQEKQGRYQAVRERLLNAVTKANQAATFALDAIEIPMQGYHGLTALAGDLAAGNSFEDSMMRAGTVARQPIEQTAYELGGAATDATGSPLVGTAVNVGAQIFEPW